MSSPEQSLAQRGPGGVVLRDSVTWSLIKFLLVGSLILPPWKREPGWPAPMVLLVGGESDMVELWVLRSS